MAAGAPDVVECVGAGVVVGTDVGVVGALDELAALLMYEVYDGDCADARLQPKKSNSSCSVKLDATLEGSSTGVVVEAT